MARANSSPHTAAPAGKRVRIVLRDGTVVNGKFKDRTDRHVFLMDGQKIPKSKIRSFVIDRSVTKERK